LPNQKPKEKYKPGEQRHSIQKTGQGISIKNYKMEEKWKKKGGLNS